MPTLPLYSHPRTSDAWHQVRAPGGYEWWYFDADDPQQDRQVIAVLFAGCIFQPEYQRRYARYAKNPTRVPPPLPEEYLYADIGVYRGGRVEHRSILPYPREQLFARGDTPELRIGPNHFFSDGPSLRLTLSDRRLRADLSFSSTPAAPGEHELFSRQVIGGEHRWVLANPLCEVEGQIALDNQTLAFRGRGYHDHNFGTAPIGPGLARWFRGRVLFQNRCLAFHFAQARDCRADEELRLIDIDQSGARDIEVAHAAIDWTAKAGWRLTYPSAVRIDDLELRAARIIDSSPFEQRLLYEAEAHGRQGRAVCHLTYPYRLRSQIWGRLIERWIDGRR